MMDPERPITADGRGQQRPITNWYAVYVKPRHEFVVEDELRKKGIETFLPTLTRLHQWKDRKKQVVVPLFPGYLFVSLAQGAEHFLRVIKTRGTVAFISLVPGHPTPVDRDEIDSLQILLRSGEQIDVYPHLQEGTPVRITRGALQGAQGVLKKKYDQHVFLVNMELLGRSVGVRVHAGDIEAT